MKTQDPEMLKLKPKIQEAVKQKHLLRIYLSWQSC